MTINAPDAVRSESVIAVVLAQLEKLLVRQSDERVQL